MRMRQILLTTLAFWTTASVAAAQGPISVHGGARAIGEDDYATHAAIGVDFRLPRDLAVGVDVTFRTFALEGSNYDSSETNAGISGVVSYELGRDQRALTPYAVGGVGLFAEDCCTRPLFALGGGLRFWIVPRLAIHADYRRYVQRVGGRSVGANALGFGLTVRP